MFFYDPGSMLLMLIGLPLVLIPQWWVKKTVEDCGKIANLSGQSGLQVAQDILSRNGLSSVQVELVEGELSDHYDPSTKTVRLSPDIYHGKTLSATAIAAHEVGHALQHAQGYYPVVLRSAMVPAVNIGSQFGPMLLIGSFVLMSMHILAPSLGMLLAWTGVIFFGLSVAFHFVTLPVEINASMRAIKVLSDGHYLQTQEIPYAKKVLTAAALTYVSVALYSLMQFLYYVLRLMGSRRN